MFDATPIAGLGMLTFLELAHMFDATQIGGFGMLTFFELAHMFDATQIGGFGMLTFLELAHMFDATQSGGFGMLTVIELAHMFDAIVSHAQGEFSRNQSRGCWPKLQIHTGTVDSIWQNITDWVPNSLCAQRSGKVNSSLMTYCRQWQMAMAKRTRVVQRSHGHHR